MGKAGHFQLWQFSVHRLLSNFSVAPLTLHSKVQDKDSAGRDLSLQQTQHSIRKRKTSECLPIQISLYIPDLIGLNADEPEYQRACGMVVFCWAEPSILARSSISPIPNRSLPPRGINPGNRERLGLKTRSTHLRLKIATSSSPYLIPKTANTIWGNILCGPWHLFLYLSKIHLADRNFLLCVHKLRIEFQKKIFAQYRATIHFHFLISQFLSVQLSVQTSRRWSHHQCILGTYLQRI